ncbi:hypothetical protein [Nocardia sp. NPDC056100]|uniref:hypothetical protein n=1 Tax=Nocardia sp. NPDC056100 TaxID=3345712 RepID=UPI0035D74983
MDKDRYDYLRCAMTQRRNMMMWIGRFIAIGCLAASFGLLALGSVINDRAECLMFDGWAQHCVTYADSTRSPYTVAAVLLAAFAGVILLMATASRVLKSTERQRK